GLPAFGVFALPELHGLGVVLDVAVSRVAGQRAAGAMGNIAQVAKQGALVPLFNLGVQRQRTVVANRVEEVHDMLPVAQAGRLGVVDQLIASVEYAMRPVAIELQRAVVAVEGNEPGTMPIAAQPLPADGPLAFELEVDVMR